VCANIKELEGKEARTIVFPPYYRNLCVRTTLRARSETIEYLTRVPYARAEKLETPNSKNEGTVCTVNNGRKFRVDGSVFRRNGARIISEIKSGVLAAKSRI